MTTVPGTNFTKEQLDVDLIVHYVSGSDRTGSNKLNRIGFVYHYEKKKKYDKALAWYLLAAREANPGAHNNIGILYRDELGVPKNYLCAMTWFLKATQLSNDPNIFNNIGDLFERGCGVPLDRYKALEWYCHGGVTYRDKLKSQGYHRFATGKKKTLQQFIRETKVIHDAEKKKLEEKQDKIQQEMEALVDVKITYKLVNGGKDAWKDVPILFADGRQRYEQLVNSSVTNNDNEILELKKQIKLLKQDKNTIKSQAKQLESLTQEKLNLKLQIMKRDKEIISLRNDKESLQQGNSSVQHQTKGSKMNSLQVENQELKLNIISLQTENQSLKHRFDEYEQQLKSKDNTTQFLESDGEDINL